MLRFLLLLLWFASSQHTVVLDDGYGKAAQRVHGDMMEKGFACSSLGGPYSRESGSCWSMLNGGQHNEKPNAKKSAISMFSQNRNLFLRSKSAEPSTPSGPKAAPAAPPVAPPDLTGTTDPAAAMVFDGTRYYEMQPSEEHAKISLDRECTLTTRFKTRGVSGVILAKTRHGIKWVPDALALFVQKGVLCYDVGWTGVVCSTARVDDGEWHEAIVIFSKTTGLSTMGVSIIVDGKIEVLREHLQPGSYHHTDLLRIGFAAIDFPLPSSRFVGIIDFIRYISVAVAPEFPQMQTLATLHKWIDAQVTSGNTHLSRQLGPVSSGPKQNHRWTSLAIPKASTFVVTFVNDAGRAMKLFRLDTSSKQARRYEDFAQKPRELQQLLTQIAVLGPQEKIAYAVYAGDEFVAGWDGIMSESDSSPFEWFQVPSSDSPTMTHRWTKTNSPKN